MEAFGPDKLINKRQVALELCVSVINRLIGECDQPVLKIDLSHHYIPWETNEENIINLYNRAGWSKVTFEKIYSKDKQYEEYKNPPYRMYLTLEK